MKTVKIVTSIDESLYNAYAKQTLASWAQFLNLDNGSVIEVWVRGKFPEGLPKVLAKNETVQFKYKSLDTQSHGWKYFIQEYGRTPKPQTPKGQEFRFNFQPFSCKVFALAEAAYDIKLSLEGQKAPYDLMVWLDADVRLTQETTGEYLANTLGANDIAWLDRGLPWRHGETGYIAARATNPEAMDVFLTQANWWGSGMLFYFQEWHDAFSFSSLMACEKFSGRVQIGNLNQDMNNDHENGLYPFKTSMLGDHMLHYKGALKFTKEDDNEPKPIQMETFSEVVFNADK